MEDCVFKESDIFQLLQMCPQLQKLKFLNVCRNSQLLQDILLGNVFSLSNTPSLEVLKVSYPAEVFAVGIEEEEVNAEKQVFKLRMNTILSSLCDKKGRPYIKLDFAS